MPDVKPLLSLVRLPLLLKICVRPVDQVRFQSKSKWIYAEEQKLKRRKTAASTAVDLYLAHSPEEYV
ncbi:hypothetical protein AALO_G00202500 [Alosa alosa]|uniref:Uncharacterized protein n=1 Tax=Alosa alosa TaxID=278164 RepID=A0AAV6G7U6_9TELE|nr:hypothetical protein AALO_G00202500 [Alosa alosa]